MPCRKHIILFTRYPIVGRCKTRMFKALGPDGAANLQRQLTEHVVSRMQKLLQSQNVNLNIWYCDGTKADMLNWLGPTPEYHKQPEGSLGNRMAVAFNQAWMDGAQRALLIGSDCPAIDETIIGKGFTALTTEDIVFGPAADGGYYLIGMQQAVAGQAKGLFDDQLPWGSPSLLTQTLRRAADARLTCAQLPTLHDIDEPDDLIHFRNHTDQKRS